MPELPEVETVRRALEKSLVDYYLTDITCYRLSLRYPLPLNFDDLLGHKIINVKRRAKYLLLNFGNGLTLLWHLGMSGRVIIKHNDLLSEDFDKHDHVVFQSSNQLRIVYRDVRRFGFMRLLATQELKTLSFLKDIGPEPLDLKLDAITFHQVLQHHNISIKSALLDQKIIAGIGNIYACEALWMAQISPFRRSNDVTLLEVKKLVVALQDVLQRAIDHGGSTLKDHAQPNGEIGYFQNHLNAYNRHDNVCAICQVNLIIKLKQSGRSTYYCQFCQL